MIARHRKRVEQAFSAAADYDRYAVVQRIVARRLAARIATLALPGHPRILEIGCGTGFLTETLLARFSEAEWLVTDISPAMVERCHARVGTGTNCRFATLDGEYGVLDSEGGFDLICSSLAMQWFDNHETALRRMLDWLAPGGHCLFATLGAESFAEWRAAHEYEHLAPGTPPFLPAAAFDAILPDARAGEHVIERLVENHPTALDFIRSVRAIGAQTSRKGHRPLDPSALRRVMRRFDAAGARASYEVVIGHYRRISAGS